MPSSNFYRRIWFLSRNSDGKIAIGAVERRWNLLWEWGGERLGRRVK